MADQDKDPLVSAFFFVKFGDIEGAFRELTGLGSENEVVDYKASGKQGQLVLKKIPARMKWNDITLKKGITANNKMWEWRNKIEEGKIEDARTNGSITLHDQSGAAIARWDFVRAWPSKVNGPTFNASNNEIGIEEMVLVHEGFKRVPA